MRGVIRNSESADFDGILVVVLSVSGGGGATAVSVEEEFHLISTSLGQYRTH